MLPVLRRYPGPEEIEMTVRCMNQREIMNRWKEGMRARKVPTIGFKREGKGK